MAVQNDYGPSPNKRKKKDYYARMKSTDKDAQLTEVQKFLKKPIGTLEQFKDFPTMEKIFRYTKLFVFLLLKLFDCHIARNDTQSFIRTYNAGLPASAAVERLFSHAGLICTPKRSKLSDENFSLLLFLKFNNAVKYQL